MTTRPRTTLDARFSIPGAAPTDWDEGLEHIQAAEIFWLTTVRADGRPHVTPLLSVWLDGAAYFCTGPEEQKAKNLEHHTHCALTTGSNELNEGLDVVLEGEARLVEDDALLRRLASAWEAKYGSDWHFDVRDGAFHGEGGRALVFEVAPAKALGFRKGKYSQTRWRF